MPGLIIAVNREDGIEPGRMWTAAGRGLRPLRGKSGPCAPPLSCLFLKILCMHGRRRPSAGGGASAAAADLSVDCCRSDRHYLEFLPTSGNKVLAARTVNGGRGRPVLHSIAIVDTKTSMPGSPCAAPALPGWSHRGREARRGLDQRPLRSRRRRQVSSTTCVRSANASFARHHALKNFVGLRVTALPCAASRCVRKRGALFFRPREMRAWAEHRDRWRRFRGQSCVLMILGPRDSSSGSGFSEPG
jgi:hypothetical protein